MFLTSATCAIPATRNGKVKRMSKVKDCPFAHCATAEEFEALRWLNRTFESIIKKGPTHQSYKKALLCQNFFRESGLHNIRMHDLVHVLMGHPPDEGSELSKQIAEMQMRIQPPGEA